MKYIKIIALIAVLLLATPALAFIPGDINQDDTIDSADLAILTAAYNSTPSDLNWNLTADINQDGIVDFADFTVLSQNYGSTTPTVVISNVTPTTSSGGGWGCVHYFPLFK